jgi:hypothetical protein
MTAASMQRILASISVQKAFNFISANKHDVLLAGGSAAGSSANRCFAIHRDINLWARRLRWLSQQDASILRPNE